MDTEGCSRVGDSTELVDGVADGPGSRRGLRVSEDLGSQLKDDVALESGCASDMDGLTQGMSKLGIPLRPFGRRALVSLASASLHGVHLGRQYALHDKVNAVNGPFASATTLTPTYLVSTGGTRPAAYGVKPPFFVDGLRVDNAIHYISLTFAGLRVQAMAAASEDQANTITTPDTVALPYEAVRLGYFKEAINVAVSHDQNRNGSIPGTHDNGLHSAANHGAGMAKVVAGYHRSKEFTLLGMAYSGVPSCSNAVPTNSANAGFALDERKAYTVAVAMPIGSTTLGAAHMRVKYANLDDTLSANVGGFVVGATHGLSTLTTLYAAASVANGDLKEPIQEKHVVQIGLRKAFRAATGGEGTASAGSPRSWPCVAISRARRDLSVRRCARATSR